MRRLPIRLARRSSARHDKRPVKDESLLEKLFGHSPKHAPDISNRLAILAGEHPPVSEALMTISASVHNTATVPGVEGRQRKGPAFCCLWHWFFSAVHGFV
jgi:hypothetical protein